jgi:hypothetical protein
MTQEHPITPPPELVEKWSTEIYEQTESDVLRDSYIATQAARWGADQELEACCEVLARELICDGKHVATDLRTVRRPKPQSLKEQALEALDEEHADMRIQNYRLIRSVLESLPS